MARESDIELIRASIHKFLTLHPKPEYVTPSARSLEAEAVDAGQKALEALGRLDVHPLSFPTTSPIFGDSDA